MHTSDIQLLDETGGEIVLLFQCLFSCSCLLKTEVIVYQGKLSEQALDNLQQHLNDTD
jgi:hypothetical protein